MVGDVGPAGGVDGDFEQLGGAFGEELHAVGGGGHEDALAGMHGDEGVERFDGGDAVDAEVDDEAVGVLEVFAHGGVEVDQAGGEIGAVGERDGLVALGLVACVGVAADGGEVDGVEGLVGVELAEVTVGIAATIVVEAVGAVGGLLYFGHHEAFAEGVDAAGGDEIDVAGLGLFGMEQLLEASCVEGGAVEVGRSVAAETADEACAGVGLHDVPHLGLAAGHAALLGEGVVGVHLNGEVLGGVDDFEEEGELVAEAVVDALADEVAHVDFDGFVERVVGQEAVGDDRLAPLDRGEHPELAAVGEGVVAEAIVAQAVATPDDLFVEGEEFERVESRLHSGKGGVNRSVWCGRWTCCCL